MPWRLVSPGYFLLLLGFSNLSMSRVKTSQLYMITVDSSFPHIQQTKTPLNRWDLPKFFLTDWGQVTHICIVKLTIIGSDNGLSPGQRQSILWTNAGILLIGPLGTNFSEISIGIQTFSFKKYALENGICEMASILPRPQCVNTLRPEM